MPKHQQALENSSSHTSHTIEAKAIKPRFRAYGICLEEFAQNILVRCPKCHAPIPSCSSDRGSSWRIACTHCSYTKVAYRDSRRQQSMPWWQEDWWAEHRKYSGAIDPVFGLPLWLQISCCGQILWAYNHAHLDFLEHYVQATIRERQGTKGNHHGIAIRLPRWIKLAKNRQPILKA